MKTVLGILIGLTLVLGVLLPVSSAGAKPARIEFTGSESCTGDLKFIRQWITGPNFQARGLTETCLDTADIPEMTGIDYLYDGKVSIVGENGNFILSGKLRMESNEGGAWVGSWVLPANSDTIQVIGHGEGIYEGYQLHWFLSLDGPFYGYIIEKGD